MQPDLFSLIVALNSFLLAVVGYFLNRFMQRDDQKTDALIALASEVKILVVNQNNDKDALAKHEQANKEEFLRIRREMETLGKRDHEIANLLHGLWGTAQVEGWNLPDVQPITRRKMK